MQLAGGLADGLSIHPFGSYCYATNVVINYVETGASRDGRDFHKISIVATLFVITGEREAE